MKKAKHSSEFMYRFLRPILGTVFKLYYHPTIIGQENIPKTGPILIVGNHKHLMDQCGPIIATKRVIHYMAKDEYFKGKWAWFFRITGCIPVNRRIKDTKAKEMAIDLLNDTKAIGIFPEGTRNKTTKTLLPFKYGAVSMAKKTDAFLVPFAITGDYQFRSHNLVYHFGKPFKVTDLDLGEANHLLEGTIKTLIEEGSRQKKN